MQLLLTKSKWEMWDDSLPDFLIRASADGFDAVEIYLPAQKESAQEIACQVEDHGLQLVAQISTEGRDAKAHMESLKERFAFAVETSPLLVNSHSARDIFSFEANLEIFTLGCELSKQSGITFTNETHRRRPTSSGPQTRVYLEALPQLRLTADFSHWCCVHESDLTDQHENVELAIQHTSHIHGRVGYDEGPQVPDPLAPEWAQWTALHLGWWQRIIDQHRERGADYLTITPEFGPPRYMHTEPYTERPLADAWTINVLFKDYLKEHLRI